jgi:ribose-phosphate pyrophosphokinase
MFSIKNILTATKVRDIESGKIIRTEVPNLNVTDIDHEFKYVIVDDICDGGRTFIELAKVIKQRRPNTEIYLIVTHGIFSAGLSELKNYFKTIYTTNSVKDIDNQQIVGDLQVKQLNLF